MLEATRDRRLFVAWRDPENHRILPVGVLVVRLGEAGRRRYEFAYLPGATELPRFRPFASFPVLGRLYESERLFPLFENRIMPRERPDYSAYLKRLDLPPDTDPFVVLAESGGRKATDRIEVFPEPEVDPATGRLICRFFSRGIQHVDGAEEVIASLREDDSLSLVEDPDNPVNPRALLLQDESHRVVGYVPDYLVEFLRDVQRECGNDLSVRVAHVNPPDTAVHMRLLCRVESCLPEGYEPFSGPDFQPIKGVVATS